MDTCLEQGDVRTAGSLGVMHAQLLHVPKFFPPHVQGSLLTRVIASLDPNLFVSFYLYVKLCYRLLGSSCSFPVVLVIELGPEELHPVGWPRSVISAALPAEPVFRDKGHSSQSPSTDL